MTLARKVTKRTEFVVTMMTTLDSCHIDESVRVADTKERAYEILDDWIENGPGRNRTAIVTQRDIYEEVIATSGKVTT